LGKIACGDFAGHQLSLPPAKGVTFAGCASRTPSPAILADISFVVASQRPAKHQQDFGNLNSV
jgi:hypothetical protein